MGETSGRRALDILDETLSQEAEMARLLQRMQGVDSRLVRIQGGRQYTKEEFGGESEYETLPFFIFHLEFRGSECKRQGIAKDLAAVMTEIDCRLKVSSFATRGDSSHYFLVFDVDHLAQSARDSFGHSMDGMCSIALDIMQSTLRTLGFQKQCNPDGMESRELVKAFVILIMFGNPKIQGCRLHGRYCANQTLYNRQPKDCPRCWSVLLEFRKSHPSKSARKPIKLSKYCKALCFYRRGIITKGAFNQKYHSEDVAKQILHEMEKQGPSVVKEFATPPSQREVVANVSVHYFDSSINDQHFMGSNEGLDCLGNAPGPSIDVRQSPTQMENESMETNTLQIMNNSNEYNSSSMDMDCQQISD